MRKAQLRMKTILAALLLFFATALVLSSAVEVDNIKRSEFDFDVEEGSSGNYFIRVPRQKRYALIQESISSDSSDSFTDDPLRQLLITPAASRETEIRDISPMACMCRFGYVISSIAAALTIMIVTTDQLLMDHFSDLQVKAINVAMVTVLILVFGIIYWRLVVNGYL